MVSLSVAVASRWFEGANAVGVLGAGCVFAGVASRSWWLPPTAAIGAWLDVLILQITGASAADALLVAVAAGVPIFASVAGTFGGKRSLPDRRVRRVFGRPTENRLTAAAALGAFVALAVVSAG